MIASLKGVLTLKKPPVIVIVVQGVGYELQVSMPTCYNLPELNQEVMLYTHLIVREDSQALYGFTTIAERDVFRLLIKISGVGPKMALAILSSMDLAALLQCVEFADLARLQKVPGVGKKTAERLMIEMRSKLLGKNFGSDSNMNITLTAPNSKAQDAIDALISLGYKQADAAKAIGKIATDNATDNSATLIKKALQEFA